MKISNFYCRNKQIVIIFNKVYNNKIHFSIIKLKQVIFMAFSEQLDFTLATDGWKLNYWIIQKSKLTFTAEKIFFD